MKFASIFGKNLNKQNTVTINGKTYAGGKSIQVMNNKVIIDGKDVTPDSKQIKISVEGNIDTLHVDCADTIEILGDVNSVKTSSGDIKCETVKRDIQTMSGDVHCTNFNGNFNSMSGSVITSRQK